MDRARKPDFLTGAAQSANSPVAGPRIKPAYARHPVPCGPSSILAPAVNETGNLIATLNEESAHCHAREQLSNKSIRLQPTLLRWPGLDLHACKMTSRWRCGWADKSQPVRQIKGAFTYLFPPCRLSHRAPLYCLWVGPQAKAASQLRSRILLPALAALASSACQIRRSCRR